MDMDVVNVGFSYDGHHQLFSNVSFAVKPGEIISILGPNGIGKTTLLNCLAGLAVPNEGSIFLEGRDFREFSCREVAQIISYVPQIIQPYFDYTVLEYAVTGWAPRLGTFQRPRPEHYQQAMSIMEQMDIGHLSQRPYTKLSGGERQQVCIARALIQQPSIILMDEPTAHLDYGNQIKILKIIRRMALDGYSVVLTTHNPDHVFQLQSKAAAFTQTGEFFFGGYQEILTEAFLRYVYGMELHLCQVERIGRSVCLPAAL